MFKQDPSMLTPLPPQSPQRPLTFKQHPSRQFHVEFHHIGKIKYTYNILALVFSFFNISHIYDIIFKINNIFIDIFSILIMASINNINTILFIKFV